MQPGPENQNMPPDALNEARPRSKAIPGIGGLFLKNSRLEWAILFAFCVVMLGQELLSVRQLSQTWDEAVHLYSGYRYLKCGDLTFSPEHPPLAKSIAAAPLLGINPPVDCSPFLGDDYEEFKTAADWLYSGNWRLELFQARAAISVFSMFLCVLAWIAARWMFDAGTALLATLLLVFEPNILANGALITTDVAVTAMIFFAITSFYLWARRPSLPWLLLVGLAVGLTLLTKLSSVVIIPILTVLAIADAYFRGDIRKPALQLILRNLAALGAILLIAFAVVWMGYGMRYSAQPGAGIHAAVEPHQAAATMPIRVLDAMQGHHLLPQAYMEGVSFLLQEVDAPESATIYMLGRFYPRAPWFSLAVHFLIRATAGFLAIMLLSIVGFKGIYKKHRREVVFLVLPITFFAAGFIHAGWNAGIRHLLPIFPFITIIAAAGCVEAARRFSWAKYAILAFSFLHVASSLHAFPNYLSYGNELWGGPTETYKYLEGIDIGQSYWQARTYMSGHPSERCWFLGDGMPMTDYYGLPCEHVGHLRPGLAPSRMDGTVLVSSWAMTSSNVDSYGVEPFENTRPAETIGGSAILVYRGTFNTQSIASMSETLVAREMANRSQLREALRFSDHAIQTLPDSPYGHYVHAVILAKLGQPRTAIEELELARGLALKQPTKVASIPVIDQSLLELRNILQAN